MLKRGVGIQESAEIDEAVKDKSENAGEETGDDRNASEFYSPLDSWMGGDVDGGGWLGIWTQLALAYAVHKSFIFIRIPLTAAVTPKVVKVLRGWGWDIGKKGKPKIGSIPGRKKD